MKQVLILALAIASSAGLGLAAPCAAGSLASYSAASFSCTIGGDTLSNFKVLTPPVGSPIANSSIIITPSGGAYNPTLTFSTNPIQNASGAMALETLFTYDISGLSYVGISSTLSGSSETADGAVTGIVNFCEGSHFGPDGVDGCMAAYGGLLTLDGAQNTDMSALGGVTLLNVTNDFTIDPGNNGTASGGTFTNSFTAVPEPFTSALAGLGVALIGALKIRAFRPKKESNQGAMTNE